MLRPDTLSTPFTLNFNEPPFQVAELTALHDTLEVEEQELQEEYVAKMRSTEEMRATLQAVGERKEELVAVEQKAQEEREAAETRLMEAHKVRDRH